MAQPGALEALLTVEAVDIAVVIPAFGVGVALLGFVWRRHTWKAARRTDVRVRAEQASSGLDIALTGMTAEVEQVIAVHVSNHGERAEYVMWVGVQTTAGDLLADDRPRAQKLVDDPAPEPRELPPRGQLTAHFKIAASAVEAGFAGFAVLGTDKRICSPPAMPDAGIADIQEEIMRVVRQATRGDGG